MMSTIPAVDLMGTTLVVDLIMEVDLVATILVVDLT